ncbi:hypothetical protein HRbin36_00133 [bacterium HR36]|nr:hypothetical protein HRbin36_00133 [bacterium HR36]
MSGSLVACPGCGKRLRIVRGSPGQEIICPNCGEHFRLRVSPRSAGSALSDVEVVDDDVYEDEEDQDNDFYGQPGRKRRPSEQSTLFLIIVGGALGLGLLGLIVAFVAVTMLERPAAMQQAGPARQVNQFQPQPNPPNAPPPPNKAVTSPLPGGGTAPESTGSNPAAKSGAALGQNPQAERYEKIVERIWQLAEEMWVAYKQTQAGAPGVGGVRLLPPPQAQLFAERMQAVNKELLALITEARQMPPPDPQLLAKLRDLNARKYRELLKRHNIVIIGPPTVPVPLPLGPGGGLGPALRPAEKALSEFQNILDLGPNWTPK